MKDKDNVLRVIDDADNMLAILIDLAKKQAIDTNEAVLRLSEIRAKLQFVNERVVIS